jgi:hypothetical protein
MCTMYCTLTVYSAFATSLTYGRFPRGALIQGGVKVHKDPFQKHEQRIGGLLLFWYAYPTLIVQETAL